MWIMTTTDDVENLKNTFVGHSRGLYKVFDFMRIFVLGDVYSAPRVNSNLFVSPSSGHSSPEPQLDDRF